LLQQIVEPAARVIIGQVEPIAVACEGKDRVQLVSQLERDFGGDLVGAIREG
jgi:hypothetical protein